MIIRPNLSDKVKRVLPGIDGFLNGCLDKNPDQRIPNGQEAFRQLREVAENAAIDYDPPITRPARLLRKGRSLKQQLRRWGVPVVIALLATFMLSRELSQGMPEETLRIPILQSEDYPAWNHSGTHIAYTIGDHPQRTMAVREVNTDSGPEFHPLPDGFRVSSINWARDDSLMVLSGQTGAILYHVGTRTWKRIVDYWVRDPCWCRDGRRLLWNNESERFDKIEVVTDIGWPGPGEDLEPVITKVPVEGLPTPIDGLGIYNPVFAHDDSRIIFILYRMAANLGVWSVPAEGGQATRAISGEEIDVWKLQWDDDRGELLCLEHGDDQRLMRLKIGKRSGLVRSVRQVRFPAGAGEAITDFNYHPATARYVIRTVVEHNDLWTSPLMSNERGFTRFRMDFNQILTPSVSPDLSELLFVGVDVDVGVLIQVLDLESGTYRPLHPPTGDYGSENHPQVDPVDSRYVIFTGRPKSGDAVICYWDRHEGRIRSLDMNMEAEGGNISNPIWSADGSHIYYRVNLSDRDPPYSQLRIPIERTALLQPSGPPDTLWTGHDIYHLIPGPGDDYAICQRGRGRTAVLAVMDLRSGEMRDLAPGEQPAFSPDRDEVYYQSGTGIWRIRTWRDGFNRRLAPELVVEFPPGVVDLSIGPCLAASDDSLFAVLQYKGAGDLRVFRIP